MGTSWPAAWYAPPGVSGQDLKTAIDACFARIIASMSTWELRSEISRYNRFGAGDYICVHSMFSDVPRMALEVASSSGGAFDPCVGGAVSQRGFGGECCANTDGPILSGPAVWASIAPQRDTLFQRGGVVLDLLAIAKGYTVDAMADVMVQQGALQCLVEIGGEYVARGVKPDSIPWWVDTENPYPEGFAWRLALCGTALATSGDYRKVRFDHGERLSHIVWHPERVCEYGDLASVSVLHASCALADAWATALFAAGDAEGMAMADKEDLAVVFQYRNAPPRLSRRIKAWLA